jgi:hypothetical protein
MFDFTGSRLYQRLPQRDQRNNGDAGLKGKPDDEYEQKSRSHVEGDKKHSGVFQFLSSTNR